MMTLLNHQVAALQPMIVGIGGKQVNSILANKIIIQFTHFSETAKFLTVIVCVSECELKNETIHSSLLVVRGDIRGILGDKDVRRNTATAINRTSDTCVIGRACVFDAVL